MNGHKGNCDVFQDSPVDYHQCTCGYEERKMKLYEFKIASIAFCFCLGIITLLVFGLVWLNKEFTTQDGLVSIVKDNNKTFEEDMQSMNKRISNLEDGIMPACFRELPKKSMHK